MKALAIAFLLAACVPTPPPDLSGVWRVEIHEANAPPPIVTLTFAMVFAQSAGLVRGLGYLGSLPVLLEGTCGDFLCHLHVAAGAYRMEWVVHTTSFGWTGRILSAGFDFGVVHGRKLTEGDW